MTAIKATEEKCVNLDDILAKFSIFGRYHGVSMLLIALGCVTNAIYCANYVFVAEQVGYRCSDAISDNGSDASARCSQNCSQWIYDNPHSFVAEFQLACQEWKRTLVGTVHSFGYMVGLLLVGPMSDRLGRKIAIVVTGVTGGVIGVARSFTSHYWLYIALEFLEAAIGDICSPIYMLTVEMVATKNRVVFVIISCLGYPVGGMLLALAAWLVPYWRSLLRVIYAPALLFLLYAYLVDESPRWLLSKGDREKTKDIIEKAAKINKMEIDRSTLSQLTCEQEEKVNFVVLLKTTFSSYALLKRFVVCIVWWTTSTFVNYGMTINSVSLEGNKYVNFALMNVLEMPGSAVIAYILIYFKRKRPLIFFFTAGALLCLVQPFVPNNIAWLSVTLYLAGKLMSSFYFTITYIYTSELFPTYTRNSMQALCSSLGRIGSIIAPQTPLLMQYWSGLPSLAFGSASLFAALMTLLVPDTAHASLPDTVRQAEALGVKSDAQSNTATKSDSIR